MLNCCLLIMTQNTANGNTYAPEGQEKNDFFEGMRRTAGGIFPDRAAGGSTLSRLRRQLPLKRELVWEVGYGGGVRRKGSGLPKSGAAHC